MTEVSGRTTSYSLDLLEQEGHDLAALIGDSGLDLARLRDPRARIPWDAFLTFLDRIEAVCGPEAVDTLGGRAILSRPQKGALRAFTRMAASEERQWRWIADHMAPALYRVAPGVPEICTFEKLADGRFRLRLRIPDGERESERFMRWQLGIFRVIPRVVGENRDPEIEVAIGPRDATFDIQPGPRVGWFRRLRRRASGLLAAFEEIEERQQLVEQATDRSIADQRSLAALGDVANAITQSTDFGSTADRIVDAIVSHTDAVAATLYVLNPEKTSLELAAVRSPGPEPPPRIAYPTEVSRLVLESGRVLWARSTNDVERLDVGLARALDEAELAGFAVVPLGLHEESIGTLGLGFEQLRPFSAEEERSLTTLGTTAAAALLASRHVARIEQEIEQRAATEARLRESEERLRQIAENVDGVFYLLDMDRLELLYVSPSYERLTGFPAHELRDGGRGGYVELIVPEDRERVMQTMLRLTETGGYEIEYRMRNREGRLISVLERASLIAGTDSEGPRAVGYAQDVSRLREVEHQLQHAQKMEAVGRLAGGIAHDFNNLLTVILGDAEILQSELDPGEHAHTLATEIAATGESAGRLTRGLLTLARQQPLNVEFVDLATVVRDLEPMTRSIAGPDVRVELDPGAHEAVVEMDRSQLEQVHLNLVVNACDAMRGRGELAIRVRTAGKDDDEIVLSVSDTGCGMTLDEQRSIFDPFFSTKDSGDHSGLGLSIVNSIIEKAGGSIRVDSAAGEGARFDVFLPQASKTMPEAQPAETGTARGNETILLVEDDDAVRATTANGLRARGYHVVEASGAESALAVLPTLDPAPDLVLTDLRMPGMHGVELAERLAEDAPGLRVLFMTGFPGEAQPEGVADVPVLVKPFRSAELARAVRDRLDGPSS